MGIGSCDNDARGRHVHNYGGCICVWFRDSQWGWRGCVIVVADSVWTRQRRRRIVDIGLFFLVEFVRVGVVVTRVRRTPATERFKGLREVAPRLLGAGSIAGSAGIPSQRRHRCGGCHGSIGYSL